MLTIDTLCYTSNLRYVNACEKFAFAAATIVLCVVSRSIAVACVVLLVTGWLTIRKGGISFFRYEKLMRIPIFFLLLSTITIIVNISRTPMNAFAFNAGNYYLTGDWDSILFGVQLILTALASVSCLYFLSLNTPMTDILDILTKLHCPKIVIELMLLIYRFIFVLLSIASAISTSQDSRLGNVTLRTSYRSFGTMISALFIRAFKKSNALYDAMESRCYDGTIHVLNESHPAKKREILAIILFEIVLLLIWILELYIKSYPIF